MKSQFLATLIFAATLAPLCGQTPPPFTTSVRPASLPVEAPDPIISQFRKSVTFIHLVCTDGNLRYDVKGTGFFVSYPDARFGPRAFFTYLVTNRHVAECENDKGESMKVESISILLNRRGVLTGPSVTEVPLNLAGNASWHLPPDESVDLAVMSIQPNPEEFDFKYAPFSMLAGKDFLKSKRVTEGEPVMFSGFFTQFPGVTKMEPIVRQGIIAMMPDDPVPFAKKWERVYSADMHVFGGNSGSPAYINLGGYREGNIYASVDYHIIGVVNGDVTEDENFNLELASTAKGTAKANSGVSSIVPAEELIKLMQGPDLSSIRDDEFKKLGKH